MTSRRTRKKVCATCKGEGQIETFEIVGRGKNAVRIETFALCLDCIGLKK